MLFDRETRCKCSAEMRLLNSPSEARRLLYHCVPCHTFGEAENGSCQEPKVAATFKLASGVDIDSLWHDKTVYDDLYNGVAGKIYRLLHDGRLAAEIDSFGTVTVFNWFQNQVETAFAGHLLPQARAPEKRTV